MAGPTRELLDRLYRQHAGTLAAALTRRFGPGRLDAVEAALHDAFVAAHEAWPRTGVPENPAAWLMTVARRKALDVAKGERRRPSEGEEALGLLEAAPEAGGRAEGTDDELRMMFVACHPALTVESQLALTLRTLGGLEVEEIAGALLAAPAAVEKRLVRARQALREAGVAFSMPGPAEEAARLAVVLRVLYLLFSEGYSAHRGESPIRAELASEAIRLLGLLLAAPALATPEAHALSALMLLQASRFAARVDAAGNLRSLVEQDRRLWDRGLVERGLAALARSASGERLSEYHLEAGIAACHALAPTVEATDWGRIVAYYDELVLLNDSPVIRVNRAIATAYAEGPERGLRELAGLEKDPRLARWGVLVAARADLFAKVGDARGARAAYERALGLVDTEAERRLLRRRLSEL